MPLLVQLSSIEPKYFGSGLKPEPATQERNVKIVESVEKYSYSQKEVADYLGLHYSTISSLLKRINFISKNRIRT